MAIRIDTTAFVNAHGTEPKGRGNWAFSIEVRTQYADGWSNRDVPFFARDLTYRQAVAAVKRHAKQCYRIQDGTVRLFG